MDFSLLTPESFHLLCGRLLREEGYTIVEAAERARGIRLDYIVNPPGSSDQAVVDWAWRPGGRGGRIDVIDKVKKAVSMRELLGLPRALLIFSIPLTPPALEVIHSVPQLDVWDADHLQDLLIRYPQVQAEFSCLFEQNQRIERRIISPSKDDIQLADLIRRIASHPRGKGHWKTYEDLCVDTLNFLFVPPLGVPKIQSRSEDDLDRRDAIYPIEHGSQFWNLVRSDYRTRLVVAEFKNYTDPIGQTEVESIQQYLYAKAFRMFGLLCCRQEPSEHALKARRRAWLESDKMIVFISDSDFTEMLQRRANEEDPTAVLDLQMNEFLTSLAP